MNYGRTDHSKNVHAVRSDPNQTFAVGDRVVFPAHGVGRIEKVAKEEISGHSIEIVQISFEDSSMIIRVPVAKIGSTGLRCQRALNVVRKRALNIPHFVGAVRR